MKIEYPKSSGELKELLTKENFILFAIGICILICIGNIMAGFLKGDFDNRIIIAGLSGMAAFYLFTIKDKI